MERRNLEGSRPCELARSCFSARRDAGPPGEIYPRPRRTKVRPYQEMILAELNPH